ncbi:hypothetical protein ACJX0J_012613, partial [Zea mays]
PISILVLKCAMLCMAMYFMYDIVHLFIKEGYNFVYKYGFQILQGNNNRGRWHNICCLYSLNVQRAIHPELSLVPSSDEKLVVAAEATSSQVEATIVNPFEGLGEDNDDIDTEEDNTMIRIHSV